MFAKRWLLELVELRVAVKYLQCTKYFANLMCAEKAKVKGKRNSCSAEVLSCDDPPEVIALCERVIQGWAVQGFMFLFTVLSLEQSRIEETVNNLLMLVVC